MQEKLQGTENKFGVTERRACPRFRVTSLIYIDIGNVNGGIVTSLSENGLSLRAAATLGNGDLGTGPLRMRIQFPGIPEAIETSGELVWTGSSGKEACVRFVEIEEAAREQVRGWLSDQISLNGLRPEPPRLPKMQLPTSRRVKPRRLRFSFAEVASSRVDEESETELEDSLESIPQPRDLPSLQAGSNVFRDGSEVVASAFESPALTEDPTRNIGSQNGQTTPPTTHEQQRQEASPAIPERRQHSRRQILLFTYAVLGEDNGGLVFNLGEGGLALTAAAPLQEHHFNKIRVRFPDSEDWIETSGRLAWKSDSGKEVGIEFVDFPNDARLRIREWVSQEEPRTSQSPIQGLPSFMDSDESSAEPIETPASFEEQPFENRAFEEERFDSATGTPAAYSSALFETGIKGIFERASVRRRVAKIKPPRMGDPAAGPRALARKALSIAAGVALAAGGWMFFQRTSSNGASGIVAQNLPSTQSSHKATQEPEVEITKIGPEQPRTDPPVYEHSTIQTDTAKPSVQQIDSSSPSSSASKTAASSSNNPDLAFKAKLRSEQAPSDAPQANLPHRSEQSQLVLPARREQETKAQQTTASVPNPTPENKLAVSKPVEMKPVETKPSESRPIEVAQAVSTPNPSKDANAPPNLNSNLPIPTAAPPADNEKEKLAVTPRQPEARVTRTPTVTVSFDPYPSIRMPKAEKSKKSHQGKSLQMGRLLAHVDPTYPEEAKQQGIEGTVRVHAIFSREGTVQNLTSVSGPPVLVTAAMNAVRQWRYSQTILGGQAMETEEEVTVQFRLANSDSKN